MSSAVTAAAAERMPSPITIVRQQLDQMEEQFKAALPAHIPVERFKRVVMTAIQNNPELVECDRRSLWNAAIRAAQDGLLPDGREGAMVVRLDPRRGKVANWQPMIAGIRKKVRNSGEIADWNAYVVYENDEFEYELGDTPFIRHKPTLADPGKPIATYSVALLKSGEKSREVMPISEVYRIRDRSDAWRAFRAGKIKSTPWSTDEGEMIRKTVARRHSKVLPMSTDLDDLIRRDDALYDFQGAGDGAREPAKARPRSLTAALDAVAGLSGPAPADQHQSVDQETGEILDDDCPAADDDGPEPSELAATKAEPAPLDPFAIARKRGSEARMTGVLRKASPPEYRESPRKAELDAWLSGWDETDKTIAGEEE